MGGIILDRFPGETGFLILFIPVWICAIANIVIYFFYPDVPVLIALFLSHIFLGIGVEGFNQLSFNFTIGDTPKSERTMFVAVYSALTGVTSFLGPGGWLYEEMEKWPEALTWIATYGFQVGIGIAMLLLAFTLGRRVLLTS